MVMNENHPDWQAYRYELAVLARALWFYMMRVLRENNIRASRYGVETVNEIGRAFVHDWVRIGKWRLSYDPPALNFVLQSDKSLAMEWTLPGLIEKVRVEALISV